MLFGRKRPQVAQVQDDAGTPPSAKASGMALFLSKRVQSGATSTAPEIVPDDKRLGLVLRPLKDVPAEDAPALGLFLKPGPGARKAVVPLPNAMPKDSATPAELAPAQHKAPAAVPGRQASNAKRTNADPAVEGAPQLQPQAADAPSVDPTAAAGPAPAISAGSAMRLRKFMLGTALLAAAGAAAAAAWWAYDGWQLREQAELRERTARQAQAERERELLAVAARAASALARETSIDYGAGIAHARYIWREGTAVALQQRIADGQDFVQLTLRSRRAVPAKVKPSPPPPGCELQPAPNGATDEKVLASYTCRAALGGVHRHRNR